MPFERGLSTFRRADVTQLTCFWRTNHGFQRPGGFVFVDTSANQDHLPLQISTAAARPCKIREKWRRLGSQRFASSMEVSDVSKLLSVGKSLGIPVRVRQNSVPRDWRYAFLQKRKILGTNMDRQIASEITVYPGHQSLLRFLTAT